jgi:hypothetical protein
VQPLENMSPPLDEALLKSLMINKNI